MAFLNLDELSLTTKHKCFIRKLYCLCFAATGGHSSPISSSYGSKSHNASSGRSGGSPHHPYKAPNPSVINLPFRDRIIHLLAIRPYKKPELLARLHKGKQKRGTSHRRKNPLRMMPTFFLHLLNTLELVVIQWSWVNTKSDTLILV